MGRFRLVVLDIDGTLLDDRKEIPAVNIQALQEAREAGIRVAIASGRMVPTIEPIEERLEIDTAIIAYNGGKVVGPRSAGRSLIDHRPVPSDVAAALIDFSRQGGFLLNFYHEDRLYADDGLERRRFMEIYSGRTGSRYNVVDLAELKGRAPTKMILLAEPRERERLFGELEPSLGGRAFLSRSDPEYLEITAPGVNKGAALPALARHFGVDLSEVLAVGDADNDKELLAAAGLGVAVANARPAALEAADVVTERDNNAGAVAEAIRRFALDG